MHSDSKIQHLAVIWLAWVDKARKAPYSFMVVMSILIGMGGGLAAIGFRYLIEEATYFFAAGQTTSQAGFEGLSWYWILFMPMVGGLVVGPVIHFFAPEARGTGVAEVMESVALRGGVIRKRVGLIKAFAVALCLGSGGSAGREGPIIHVGAAVGSLVGRIFSVPIRSLRTFVGCGAAAGIAATFNAPIAGALFAGEVILGRFGVVRFSAIVISSVVATVISRMYLSHFPAFLVPRFELEHNWELLVYALVGLLAALVGCLFIGSLNQMRSLFDRMPLHPALRPAVGGLIVGLIGLLAPQVLGVGYTSINAAMNTTLAVHFLLLLLAAKLIATSLTLGSGGSGGVFAPSLFLGVCLGGATGSGLLSLFPNQVGSPGSYALVAAGAVVAATTRAPITAIIIIFELTNNYTIILPLMISCILATLLAGRVLPYSIYQAKLFQRGVNLKHDQDANVLRCIKVKQVADEPYQIIGEATPLNQILELVVSLGTPHCVVVDKQGHYRGMLRLSDLRYTHFNEKFLAPLVVAADLMHTDVPTLDPDETLDRALKVFGNWEALPVLDPADRKKLLKVLTHQSVINTYNHAVLDTELAQSTAGLMVQAEKIRFVTLGGTTTLMELEVPLRFAGKKLNELNLRNRFNAQVVLVRRRTSSSQKERLVPGPQFELQSGDIMLLVGTKEGLQRLAAL